MTRKHFCKIPNWLFLRSRDLVEAVNSGKEVFLLDLSYPCPASFIINGKLTGGGKRLRVGDSVLVTNQSQLWLVKIQRNKSGYLARCKNHSSSSTQQVDPLAPLPKGFDARIYRKARANFRAMHQRQILEGSTRNV